MKQETRKEKTGKQEKVEDGPDCEVCLLCIYLRFSGNDFGGGMLGPDIRRLREVPALCGRPGRYEEENAGFGYMKVGYIEIMISVQRKVVALFKLSRCGGTSPDQELQPLGGVIGIEIIIAFSLLLV